MNVTKEVAIAKAAFTKIFTEEEIKQVTFLGKVHKRVLLQLHKFDKRAIEILKTVKR